PRAERASGTCRESHYPRPQFLLRRIQGFKIDQPAALPEQGDGFYRTFGVRQIDLAARPQPDVRPLSAPARHRRSFGRWREHSFDSDGSESAARAHRHGVSETDAVSNVDL